MQLSEEQIRVTDHDSGNVVVVAAAGSGKTRCLVERVDRLLEKGAVESQILLFTFTKKAAEEIKSRIESKIGSNDIMTCTIHSLALRIFRDHFKLLGYDRSPTIWSPERCTRLGNQKLMEFLRLSDAEKNNAQNPWQEPISIPNVDTSNTLKDLLKKVLERFPPVPTRISGVEPIEYYTGIIKHFGKENDLIATVATDLLANKSACNVITFDDMIPAALRLLRDHREVLNETEKYRYDHIMVDEYQDVNDINVQLISELAAESKSLMVVGDDDQAIYAFRGGNTEHILSFPDRFDAEILYLTTNYRCQPGIIKLANELISHNQDRYSKEMKPAPSKSFSVCDVSLIYPFRNISGGIIHETRRDIHYEIFHYIQGLVHFVEIEPSDIAILARNNYNLNIMQKRMRYYNNQLPVERRSRDRIQFQLASLSHLYKDAYIIRIHNWFNMLINPKDTVNFREILLDSVKGFGEKSALYLADYIQQNPELDFPSQLRGLHNYSRHGAKTALGKRIEIMAQGIERLCVDAYSDDLSTLFEKIISVSGIKGELALMLSQSAKKMSKAENHLNRLEEYKEIIADFPVETIGHDAVASWMDEVATQLEFADGEHSSAVQLVTIHSSKGKEWPVVFVADLEEGILPSPRNEILEEERRLLYVAMTRAEQQLILCYSVLDDEGMPSGKSSFLSELDLSPYIQNSCEAL